MTSPHDLMKTVMETVLKILPGKQFVLIVEGLDVPGSITVAAVAFGDCPDADALKRKLMGAAMAQMDDPDSEIERGHIRGDAILAEKDRIN